MWIRRNFGMRQKNRNDSAFRLKFHTRLRARSRTKFHTRLHAELKMKRFSLSTTFFPHEIDAQEIPHEKIHNGSITFLYLAISHIFRIHHKNGFEPLRQKTECFRQRNQSPHKRDRYLS